MTEAAFHSLLVYSWFGLAALVFLVLFFIVAPYGRHGRRGWGPQIPSTLGWILMEAPAPLGMLALYCLASAERRASPVLLAFLALWLVHYLHRAFIFPFRIRARGKLMPLVVAGMAVVFNLGNAYLNGRWLFELGPAYPTEWLWDPRFLAGAAMFAAGFAVNQHSDWVLLHLRGPGETGYKVPRGGLYRYVSCPNYLGEIIEWTGWALLTWSVAGLSFAVWTAANLVPRAIAHHRWYEETFEDYPKERRAIFPFVL
jgi:protein-S-isoprenylcysteine O-methyltransferase Ste14